MTAIRDRTLGVMNGSTRIIGRGDFKRRLSVCILALLATWLVAAPVASAGTAAASDEYNPNPPGGGKHCGNKTYFKHHRKKCLRKKCHHRKFFQDHKQKCKK